jgi:hypothetical protein
MPKETMRGWLWKVNAGGKKIPEKSISPPDWGAIATLGAEVIVLIFPR